MLRQNERQCAGPKRVCQSRCFVGEMGETLRRGSAADVHNQRIEARAAFRLKDQSDGPAIGGISAEAVDSFGGKGDQVPGPKLRSCAGDRVFAHLDDRH